MTQRMRIFDQLQERLTVTSEAQRIVLFGDDASARHLSAVLVRLPPAHEFALHTHPGSEDCFFALAGSGEALEPGARIPLAAPAGVWIPVGHPHGLRAGADGMLEVGFQSPAGHAAVPFERMRDVGAGTLLSIHALADAPSPRWAPTFPKRASWRHLDAEHALLSASDSLTLGSAAFESALVVASGAIELDAPARRRVSAFAVVHFDPGPAISIRAVAPSTLVVAVKARATAAA